MSLGILEEYGSLSSESEISDSDEPASNDRTDSHQSEADQGTVVDSSHTVTCERPESSAVGDPLDYAQGDTSSSDEEQSEEDDGSPEEKDPSISLPLPDLDHQTSYSSVFSNPFKEAEEAKLAILKHHVSEFAPVEKQPPPRTRTKNCKGGPGSSTRIIGETTPTDLYGLFNADDSCASEFAGRGKRKKRSGVSDTLMPPKKYLKSYKTVQAKERPWTITTSSSKS